MEQLSKEEVLYDEHEERLKKTKARRRRTIRRRHRLHLIIALGIVLLILLYFASDLSKVRSLRVEGNRFYSDEQICEMAGAGYDTRYLLRPAFLMENALKGGSLIEDVQVEKSWNGDIRIKVEEKHVIGYLVQEDAYVLLCSSGEQITLQEDEIGSIVNYPLLNGFSDEQLDSIAQAFDEVSEEVGAELIERISEILPYETSFNQNMMKIVMRDGNTLYGSYDSVGLLQIYQAALEQLEGKNVCFYMDGENQAMSKISCSEFESSDEEKKKQDKETDAKDEGSAEEKDANAADSGENETKQEEESAGEQTA